MFPAISKYFAEVNRLRPNVSASVSVENGEKILGLSIVERADSDMPKGNVIDWISISCQIRGLKVKIGED